MARVGLVMKMNPEEYTDTFDLGTRRHEKLFVENYPQATVHPLDCVPEERPKGSWTRGVLAWQRGASSTDATIVGWFTPPRLRQKKTQILPDTVRRRIRQRDNPALLNPVKPDYAALRERRNSKSIRILRSMGYSVAEALRIVKGEHTHEHDHHDHDHHHHHHDHHHDHEVGEVHIPDFTDADALEGEE